MMKKSDQVYLQDIQESVEVIEKHVKGMNFETFSEDLKTQDAVIRRFQIIGEAVGKLRVEFKQKHPDFPIRQAKKMRNVLVHDYGEVDLNDVWETIQTDLPKLKVQVDTALLKD